MITEKPVSKDSYIGPQILYEYCHWQTLRYESKCKPYVFLKCFITWITLFIVASSTGFSEGWTMGCFKWFNPAALARGLFMRVNIVKSDTSIIFCWILDARCLHQGLELNKQRPESLQHAPTTWIWTLVYNIQLWDLPNDSESLKTRILLHYCLATAFQTKFLNCYKEKTMCAFEIHYLSMNRRQCQDFYKVYIKVQEKPTILEQLSKQL